MRRFSVVCTSSNTPGYLGPWLGLDSAEAIADTAKRDEWRSIFDDPTPTESDLRDMDVGDIWEFDDIDGNRFIITKIR